MIILILQRRQWRPREVKELSQGHTAILSQARAPRRRWDPVICKLMKLQRPVNVPTVTEGLANTTLPSRGEGCRLPELAQSPLPPSPLRP